MRDAAPPSRPWAGRMRWCDLAFLHWPVPPERIRPLVPPGLTLDLFDGRAWIGIVPFRMEGVRVRAVPPVPTVHAFAELNVRTYVRAADRAGVWFFSLDAASRLAVRGARLLFNLPYYDADIRVHAHPHGEFGPTIEFESRRTHRAAPAAAFAARYEPTSDVYEALPGTLEHFLVERYCLFTCDDRRGLGILDVDHSPWALQLARADIWTNTMAGALGIALSPGPSLAHVSRALDVLAWSRADIGTTKT